MDDRTIKTIRIGNPVSIRWTILTCGEPTPLANRNLTFYLILPSNRQQEITVCFACLILPLIFFLPESILQTKTSA